MSGALWVSSIRPTEAGVGVDGAGGAAAAAAAGTDGSFLARFAGGVAGGAMEPFVYGPWRNCSVAPSSTFLAFDFVTFGLEGSLLIIASFGESCSGIGSVDREALLVTRRTDIFILLMRMK